MPSKAERMLHDYEFEGSERQSAVDGRKELNVEMLIKLQALLLGLGVPNKAGEGDWSLVLQLRDEEFSLYWTATDTRLRLRPESGVATDGMTLELHFRGSRSEPAIEAQYFTPPLGDHSLVQDAEYGRHQGLDAVVCAVLRAHRQLIRSRSSGTG